MPPIFIKNFDWKQSENMIYIRIPMRGMSPKKVDIFVTKKFFKLHCAPFLFEAYLSHNINEEYGTCRFIDNEALIELPKEKEMYWENLEGNFNKSEKICIKQLAIAELQAKTKEKIDNKFKKIEEIEKYTLKETMKNDSEGLQKIKEIRNKEKNSVMQDFEKWRKTNEINNTIIPPIQKFTEIKKKMTTNSQQDKNLTKCNINSVNKNSVLKENNETLPLRKGGTVTVSFTERVFLTPVRESSTHVEQAWLKKMNDARKASGFVAEDLRPEERDPQWCKDKGDDLFSQGNYLGAINAYSHGIKLSHKLPYLYSNRAITHYVLGNFHKCVEDCSTALELLVPICESNFKNRIACIVRRAAALTRIGMLSKAIDEMKYAIKLQPANEKLKADLIAMEKAWEQEPDSD